MAAGSSAPELATSLIGVFVAKDPDIGIGAIVGSAVFNIAFVISICALFAGRVVTINWWPIVRDSFFYLISVCVLFIAMVDSTVTIRESIIFMSIYVVYILFMSYNKLIEKKILEIFMFFDQRSYKVFSELETIEETRNETNIYSDAESKTIKSDYGSNNGLLNNSLKIVEKLETSYPMNKSEKVWMIFVFPLKVIYRITIPDCRTAEKQNYFSITIIFFMCCVYISIFSYFIVWFIAIIGNYILQIIYLLYSETVGTDQYYLYNEVSILKKLSYSAVTFRQCQQFTITGVNCILIYN